MSSESNDSSATPDAPKMYRVNISLPPELATQLRETAENLGLSQSALIVSLISDAMGPLHKLSQRSKSISSPDSQKRFRGQSIDVILKHVSTVLKKL